MGIEWFRDLGICIMALVIIGVLTFLSVLAYSLYRRVRAILDSAKATIRTVQETSSCVRDEVVKPVIQAAAFVQGMHQGFSTIRNFFSKQEGGRDD